MDVSGHEPEEGRRMRKLRNVLDKALTASADGCAVETFEEALPRQARADAKLLAALRDEALTAVRENTEREFEDMCAERGVVSKLNALDDLIAEMPTGGGEWRVPHPAPSKTGPMEAMLRVRVRRKEQEVAALEAMLATCESDNEMFESELKALNERAILCQSQLKRKAEQMSAALVVADKFAPEDEDA